MAARGWVTPQSAPPLVRGPPLGPAIPTTVAAAVAATPVAAATEAATATAAATATHVHGFRAHARHVRALWDHLYHPMQSEGATPHDHSTARVYHIRTQREYTVWTATIAHPETQMGRQKYALQTQQKTTDAPTYLDLAVLEH